MGYSDNQVTQRIRSLRESGYSENQVIQRPYYPKNQITQRIRLCRGSGHSENQVTQRIRSLTSVSCVSSCNMFNSFASSSFQTRSISQSLSAVHTQDCINTVQQHVQLIKSHQIFYHLC